MSAPSGFVPAPAVLRRLTRAEYERTVADLLGTPAPAGLALQPDSVVAGYAAVGAATASFAERGLEQFEEAARALTEPLFADGARRLAFVGCDPGESDCVRRFVETFGRRAWRRPLRPEEVIRWAGLARELGTLLGSAWEGLAQTTAGLLQSPHFLYRVELGEPDPAMPGRHRYTAWEMASRLSYLLWGTTPDDTLLTVAASGRLLESAVLREQANRLLASPRVREASKTFFRELAGLDSELQKDTRIFPQATPELWRSMQAEVEQLFHQAAFGPDRDLRRAFEAPTTRVDSRLAALYGWKDVPADGTVPLAADGVRVGLLTTAAFLAQQGIPERGSPVLRGRFVRETLLCGHVPDPPETLDTTLKENPNARTLRDRLQVHAQNPACVACHEQMDPIGFGAADRQRLDKHLDGLVAVQKRIRAVESGGGQGCTPPKAPPAAMMGTDELEARNQVMAALLAQALVCDLTRVFSYQHHTWYSPVFRAAGNTGQQHALTHNEGGAQPQVHASVVFVMKQLATFLAALKDVKEGSGTLLDNCLVFVTSDVSEGRSHSKNNMPIVLAGGAGKALKTGLHHRAAGASSYRAHVTMFKALGVSVGSFGGGGQAESNPITELLV